jgi:hypothetical protein
MIWLTWRQNRIEGFVLLGALVLSSLFLLMTGLQMTQDFQQSGLSACLAHHPGPNVLGGICGPLATAFSNQYSSLILFAVVLMLLSSLLGVMVGAPLVAREFEQRTHQLVWLQSITRTRWLSVKVALVLLTGLLVSGALLGELSWWYRPFSQILSPLNPLAFDFSGPVLVASTVMAFGLGMFAGTLTRRTVFAIFLTLALLLAIRLPVEFGLRPNYEPPVTITWPLAQVGTLPTSVGSQDWILGGGFIDAHGNKTPSLNCNAVANGENMTPQQCLQASGYRAQYLSYQPADRFWTFQWIETSIYAGIAVLALVATFWLVRRRRV